MGQHAAGYEGCNTIKIQYNIPSGVQDPEHPNQVNPTLEHHGQPIFLTIRRDEKCFRYMIDMCCLQVLSPFIP